MTAVAKIEQHNPIGTDGFEFVEFTAPTAEGIEQLRQLFTAMGFTETAKHRSKEVWLFQQNDINIVLNGKRSINPVLADGVVFRKQLALASSSTATALRSLRRC